MEAKAMGTTPTIQSRFEVTYPRYPFAGLVRFGVWVAALLHHRTRARAARNGGQLGSGAGGAVGSAV
jgi:hypothetical protein